MARDHITTTTFRVEQACPEKLVFAVYLAFVCIHTGHSERPADTIYITTTTSPIPSTTVPSTTAAPPSSNGNDKPKRTLAPTLGYGGYNAGGSPYWTTFLQVAPLHDNVHQPSASNLNATAAPLFPLGGLSLVPALYPEPLLTQQSYYSAPAIQSATYLSKPASTSTSPQKFPVSLVQQYPVVGGLPPTTTGVVNGGLPKPSLPQSPLYQGAISLEEARQKYPQFFSNQFLPQQRPQYVAQTNTHFNSPQTIYRPLPILSSLPPPIIKSVPGPSPVPQVTEAPEGRLEKGQHRFGAYKNSKPQYLPSVGRGKDEIKPPSSGYKYVIDQPGLKGLTPAPETKQKYSSEAPLDDSKSYYKKRPISPEPTPPESSDSYRGDQRNNNDDDDERDKQETDDDDDEEEDDDNGSRSYSYYRSRPAYNRDEESDNDDEDKDHAEDSQDYIRHRKPVSDLSSRSSYPPASPFKISAQRDEPSTDHYDKLRFSSELQDSFGGFSSNLAPKVKVHSYYPDVYGSLGKSSTFYERITAPTDSTKEPSHLDSKKRTPTEPVQTLHQYRFNLPDYARVEGADGDEDSEGRYSNPTPLRLEQESQKSKYYDVTYMKKESQLR